VKEIAMKTRKMSALLVTAVAAASCIDISAPGSSLKRADVPFASYSGSFYVNGSSYGPNGEIVVPGTCLPQYTNRRDSVVIVVATDTGKVRWSTLTKTGCQQTMADVAYRGGVTNIVLTSSSGTVPLDHIAADDQEVTQMDLVGVPSNATIDLYSVANHNCTFLYYDVWASGTYEGRYTNQALSRYAIETHNSVFKSVFQCNSEYTPE
jgi:hypothetical protein